MAAGTQVSSVQPEATTRTQSTQQHGKRIVAFRGN